MPSAAGPPAPPDEVSVSPRAGSRQPPLHVRLLLLALVTAGLLVGAQLAVLLLSSPWKSVVTSWLRLGVTWLGVLVLVRVSWWFTRTHQPGAHIWWFLIGTLLCPALGLSLVMGYNWLGSSYVMPVPWWSDLFFLLMYVCFFGMLALWPGLPARK